MLELKDHQQIQLSSGVWDLTFADELAARWDANVKSAPLAGQLVAVPAAPMSDARATRIQRRK